MIAELQRMAGIAYIKTAQIYSHNFVFVLRLALCLDSTRASCTAVINELSINVQ